MYSDSFSTFHCPICDARVEEIDVRCSICGISLITYANYYKNAHRGNSEAQMVLGMFYRNGTYVERDAKKGFYWTKRAADSGNAHAKLGVACCYLDGLGVEQNYVRAIYWLIESRKGGDSDAAKKLRQFGIIDAQFVGGEDGLISLTRTK